ncbi:GDP-mannose 4,6-dehydratase [Candidatus Woesearchaeota archaeon]|nr:GDP-mannose 4,6-dehydratase [Candidatus Woesearchaeota archaeon]
MKEKNNWEEKNVFVTGGSGFVGSWLTKKLLEKNANVTVLVRDEVKNSGLNLLNVEGYNVVRGDITDYSVVERALNEFEIETVFHLAAQAIVGIANRSPLPTFRTNIMGTCNVLEAARSISTVKRVIVASSDKAYGPHEKLPYTEDFPLKGTHPYDVSKTCTDLVSQAYFHTYELPVSILRCANIYGGADMNFNRIIPGTIKSILFDEAPIIRSDGKFKRDYFYVEDAADAYILLGEQQDKKFFGEAFNFGTGIPISVLDLVDEIIKASGKTAMKPKILNQASGEIRDQFLSSEKAKKIFNWKPRFGTGEGLRKTFDWYREFFRK